MTTAKRGKRTTERPIIVNRRRDAPSWHFNKTFSIDTLVQMVTIFAFVAAPVFAWTRTMERGQEQTRVKQEAMEKRFADQLSEDRERRNAFMAQFKDLNDRMLAIQLDMAKLVATQAAQTRGAERSTR